jgi:hypothetical protein
MKELLIPGLLIALCIVVSPALADTVFAVSTDKADYYPWETVFISGAGFTPGATVSITVEWPAPDSGVYQVLPPSVADAAGTFTAAYSLTSRPNGCGLQGTYIVVATDSVSGQSATITFTDAQPARVKFATTGIDDATSITINWNGFNNGNNGGQPIAGSTTFSSPGPSSQVNLGSNTVFAYSGFPSSVTVNGYTYDLISIAPQSGFNTGAPDHLTTVTADYKKRDLILVNYVKYFQQIIMILLLLAYYIVSTLILKDSHLMKFVVLVIWNFMNN